MCTEEFIEFVCEQLKPLGEVKARKMMGDYVIHVNGKCVITACDNLCYVQMNPAIESMMAYAETGCPYEGAKTRYILDIDRQEHACKVVETLWKVLPFPKKRK